MVTSTSASKEKNTHSADFQPKIALPTKHPFQVVCQLCKRTISYSGKDGEITYAVCDQCSGI